MQISANIVSQLKSKKKIIFNSLWIITDKVIRMVGGLIVGIWFARYLGPYNFGAWNYSCSIIALAIPIINLGLNNILLTDLIKVNDKAKTLFTGLMIKLCSGLALTIIIYLFSFTLKNEQITRSLLIILSFQCIFQASDVFDLFYQSRTESKNSVFAKTSAYVLMNIIKVIALVKGYSLLFFGVLTVLEVMTSTIILLYFYFKISKQSFSSWNIDFGLIKNLLLRSWPFIITELLITLYTKLDLVMIKNMIGNVELGKYSAAVRISEIWYFIGEAITISLYPTIIKLKEKSEAEFLDGYQKLFNILTTIAVVNSIIISLLSSYITDLLYGERFVGIGSILAIHIWTGVFVYLGVGCGNWFILNNLQKYLMVRTSIGAIINILLNMILIPKYQGLGAAIATLIAQIFASVLVNAFSAKTRVIFWLQIRSFLAVVKPSIKNYI